MNTSQISSQTPPKGSSKGALFWMLFPVILLVTSVSGWLVMVSVAVNDPGFALEEDYYKKALNYDDVRAQKIVNSRLGWRIELESFKKVSNEAAVIRVVVRSQSGERIKAAAVRLHAFNNARAAFIQKVELTEDENGSYSAELTQPRKGLWELRFTAQKSDVFTQILRVDLDGMEVEGRSAI